MQHAVKPTSVLAALALTASGFVATEAVAPAPADAAVTTTQTKITSAYKLAKSRVGKTPYRSGGTSLARGADCSGFTQAVYRAKGVNLPRTAGQQRSKVRKIHKHWAKPGDLVFFGKSRTYHVGIYAGSGYVVDSPKPGRKVSKRKIWTSDVSYGTLRKRVS